MFTLGMGVHCLLMPLYNTAAGIKKKKVLA